MSLKQAVACFLAPPISPDVGCPAAHANSEFVCGDDTEVCGRCALLRPLVESFATASPDRNSEFLECFRMSLPPSVMHSGQFFDTTRRLFHLASHRPCRPDYSGIDQRLARQLVTTPYSSLQRRRRTQGPAYLDDLHGGVPPHSSAVMHPTSQVVSIGAESRCKVRAQIVAFNPSLASSGP
ncbi:hypothetical protein L227DRAFT_272035 [Lentinus tigrinus ALCF2SS1-6]|uniref:Uncharacterized protein n=1 Tax=Lentinus tigrinus ALCF2SS1-6 TaxID=1328759 RepID=A0A5C2SP62_9APHY|nr:hypothetical protein L227DRAFT_272035 [Lentinus tigrinus ALCF2SS1-6]